MNTNRSVILSVTCLGISSIVTQIVFLREFLNVFSGNELVLGLVLGNWLLLTGLGSYMGRYTEGFRNPVRWLVFCQITIALLPPIQIGVLRLLKQLFLPGIMLGIGNAFLTAFLLLLPYCLISGFLLTLFAGLISSRRDARQIGDIYVLDTIGDIIGGLIFSFILVYFFTPFQTLSFLLILNLIAAGLLSYTVRQRSSGILVFIVLVSSISIFGKFDLDWTTGQTMFPGMELIRQKTTPYGNLAVTQKNGQITVYENGIPIGTTENPIAAEEIVHYALSQHPEPNRVLLLSGGLSGAHREIEKYSVNRIDYIELDPAILNLAENILGIETDPRIRLIAEDARRFVKSAKNKYDAILVDLPDPASAQLNRFYTVEFFEEVNRALRPNGVFSFSLSGAENYANPQVRLLASAVYRSLASVFPNILIIPGAQQFFIASDRTLDYDIAERLKNRQIETRYVNQDYLTAKLTEDRLSSAREMVSVSAEINRDFFPGTYFAHLQYWLSQFESSLLLPTIFLIGIAVMLGVLLAGSERRMVPAALSATGFAGMGLEVVLLIAFQICYGYVYKQIGLIITSFMIGSALGARWSGKHSGSPQALMIRLDMLLSGTAFFIAPLLQAIRVAESPFLQTIIPSVIFALLTGGVGFLTGAQFPIAAKLTFRGVEKTTGSLYAFDLLGASIGALLISAFCIPLMGITATCYLLGSVKLISVIALRIGQIMPEEVPPRVVPGMGRLFSFGIVIFVFITIGAMIIAEETSTGIYSFSFIPVYHWFLLALLGMGILQAMELDLFRKGNGKIKKILQPVSGKVYKLTKVRPLRWINFLGFALVVFYPVFRCYFKIPYIFCHVCPRLCIFGYLRPYLVPAALIMNLEKRHWCYHVCPIGTIYHCQAHTGGKAIRRHRILYSLALLILVFTAIAYFKLLWDLDNQPVLINDWYTFFFKNVFGVSSVVIVFAILFIILGYRLRQTFCETLCPVGSFSDLLMKFERFLNRKSVYGTMRLPRSDEGVYRGET